MKILLGIFIFTTILFSCKTENKKRKNNSEQDYYYIQVDTFYENNVVDFNLTKSAVRAEFTDAKWNSRAIQSEHVPNKTDTIFTVKTKGEEYSFYNHQEDLLLLMDIDLKNSKRKIHNFFVLGMSKLNLKETLPKIDTSYNEITIGIGPSTCILHFAKGKVNRILYEAYID